MGHLRPRCHTILGEGLDVVLLEQGGTTGLSHSETLITGDRRGGENTPPYLCGRAGFSRQEAESKGRAFGALGFHRPAMN